MILLFALLAGIGIARIVSTYDVFSETWDEVAHVATGMEWLQNGSYTLEPMHPPLARVAPVEKHRIHPVRGRRSRRRSQQPAYIHVDE